MVDDCLSLLSLQTDALVPQVVSLPPAAPRLLPSKPTTGITRTKTRDQFDTVGIGRCDML
jgi:hypothetical protein